MAATAFDAMAAGASSGSGWAGASRRVRLIGQPTFPLPRSSLLPGCHGLGRPGRPRKRPKAIRYLIAYLAPEGRSIAGSADGSARLRRFGGTAAWARPCNAWLLPHRRVISAGRLARVSATAAGGRGAASAVPYGPWPAKSGMPAPFTNQDLEVV
jgi:hypothetical protein